MCFSTKGTDLAFTSTGAIITKIIVIVSAVLLCAACGNINLNTPVPPPPQLFEYSSLSTFCTLPPKELGYNTKIMFVVDQSGSNGTTDPSKSRRMDAIKNFFNKNSANTSIEWGLISFQGSGATALTTGFVSSAEFLGALGQLESITDTGGTPYKAAIFETTTAVSDAIRDETENTESTYQVIFLSDGVPTDYGSPILDSEITADIERLTQLADGRLYFSTVYYNVAGGASIGASERLEAMAQTGRGGFLDASSGGDIFIDKLAVNRITKEPYIMKDFFVYNMNSTLCDSGFLGPDSDADGLCDVDEDFYNTKYGRTISEDPELAGQFFNKQNRNSFSPFFSDYFILRKLHQESLPTCTAEEAQKDEDHDLLNACEEKFLVNRSPAGPTLTWTNQMLESPKYASDTNFDSDGDGILDTLEFFFFREKGAAMDYQNTEKLISGTSYYDLFKDHQSRIYPGSSDPYKIKVQLIERNDRGENCYTYQQEVLPMYDVKSLAAGNSPDLAHPADENVILVYYIMAPENNPNGKGVLRYSYQKIKSAQPQSHTSINFADYLFEEVAAK